MISGVVHYITKAGVIKLTLIILFAGCSYIIFSSDLVRAQSTENSVKEFEDFDYNNFGHPTKINNEWMPLTPGMQYIYLGTTVDDDGETRPHRVVITITDLTKKIDGILTVVSWDLDYSAGELVEAELAFFAQDNDGNVWRMGEYPEEYEEGEFVTAQCWIAGIKDSKAGISMKGDPRIGTRSYSQGWSPSTGFTDRGQVDQMVEKVCVPVDCYDDVLVILENSLAEPDAHQLKYWTRGVGNIRVGWKGEGEKTQEILELTEIKKLDSDALAEVRAKALELEKHAYERSKDVYGLTKPLIAKKGNQ